MLQGGHFSGIYRKVQLKPQKWTKVPKEDDETEEEFPIEALMVLKYGGVLTHAGRKQARKILCMNALHVLYVLLKLCITFTRFYCCITKSIAYFKRLLAFLQKKLVH